MGATLFKVMTSPFFHKNKELWLIFNKRNSSSQENVTWEISISQVQIIFLAITSIPIIPNKYQISGQ
jgi:hypothetical protein